MPRVRVQAEDFEPGRELEALTRGRLDVGGVASFIGLVRETIPVRYSSPDRTELKAEIKPEPNHLSFELKSK